MKRIINLMKQAVERLERADRELKAAFDYAGAVTDDEIKESYPYWW